MGSKIQSKGKDVRPPRSNIGVYLHQGLDACMVRLILTSPFVVLFLCVCTSKSSSSKKEIITNLSGAFILMKISLCVWGVFRFRCMRCEAWVVKYGWEQLLPLGRNKEQRNLGDVPGFVVARGRKVKIFDDVEGNVRLIVVFNASKYWESGSLSRWMINICKSLDVLVWTVVPTFFNVHMISRKIPVPHYMLLTNQVIRII